MKMKINLKKLAKLEKKYEESFISTDTIQKMLSVVFETRPTGVLDANYTLSLTTLEELGIIEKE